MNQEIFNILFNFLPEISLAVTVLILNAVNGIGSKPKEFSYYVFLGGVLLSAIFSLMQAYYAPQQLFSGAISADHFSYAGRVLISSSLLFIALAFYNKESSDSFGLVLVSATGAMLSVSASNFFVLFVSLEVMVIPMYLIIYYEIKPAIKYFIFSSVFMAVLVYGLSLVYGVSGSANYLDAAKFLSFNPYNTLIMIIAVILITSGFAFLSMMAPFNLSFPILAEKIKLPHLAQFVLIIGVTVILVMARFFITLFHDSNVFITDNGSYNLIAGVNWQLMLAVISGASVLTPATPAGLSAVIFSLVVFIINSLGLLYSIKLINERYNVTEIKELKGLGKNDKMLFLSFIFFLASSAGFPASAGFTGKILLYISLSGASYFWLIAMGILSSSVFLFFIYRLSVSIFSGKNLQKTEKIETLSFILLLILLIPNILLGFYFEPLLNWAKYCSNLTGI